MMSFFFCIFIMGLFLIAMSFSVQQQRAVLIGRIVAYVQQYGGTNILVRSVYDGDRDMRTFMVSYQDSDGRAQQTRCKTRYRYSPIYWQHDPANGMTTALDSKREVIDTLARENVQLRQRLAQPTLAASPSSKEQIISDLTAENEQLRAELAQLRQMQG